MQRPNLVSKYDPCAVSQRLRATEVEDCSRLHTNTPFFGFFKSSDETLFWQVWIVKRLQAATCADYYGSTRGRDTSRMRS
jgi:hypothetical protein